MTRKHRCKIWPDMGKIRFVLLLALFAVECPHVKKTPVEPLKVSIVEQTTGSNRALKHLISQRLTSALVNEEKRRFLITTGPDSVSADYIVVCEVLECRLKDLDGPRNRLSLSMKIINPKDNSIRAMTIEEGEAKASMEMLAERLVKKIAARVIKELSTVK